MRQVIRVFALCFGLLLWPAPAIMAAPPAKAFGELPVGFDAAISPDGQRIGIIANINGSYQVLTQKIDDPASRSVSLSLGSKIKPRYIHWINNERYVVSVSRQERYQHTPFISTFLYTGHVNERKGRLVVKPKKIFRQFNDTVVDWLEDDPDHILMAYSHTEFDPYPDIKKVEVATGREKTVQGSRVGVETWVTDDDGTPRIGVGATNAGKKRMIIRV